jgi:uncharacterized membrane protein
MSATTYKLVDLGVVSSLGGQATLGINESGTVFNGAGYWTLGKKNKVTYTPLAPAGGTKASIFDLNDAGQLTGEFNFTSGGFNAALFSPRKKQPHLATKIPTFGDGGEGRALNNRGMIVGTTPVDDFDPRAFVATVKNGQAVVRNLDALRPAGTNLELRYAIDVNESGQVLVSAGDVDSNVTLRGVVMKLNDNGTLASFQKLPSLPAAEPSSSPESINDNGVIVGTSGVDGFNAFHPVVWRANRKGNLVVTDLKTFGGNKGRATDVNNKGQIVGFANKQFGDLEGAVWNVNKKGKYVAQNLNDVTGGRKGLNIQYATGVNEKGQISGQAIGADFKVHAVVLLPVTSSAKPAALAKPAIVSESPAPTAANLPKATVFSTTRVTEDGAGVLG